MKIAAPHIANLFDYASYQGIDEAVLRPLLVDQDLDVCSVENSVKDTELLSVIQVLSDKVNTPYFGLYYGCYLNLKALGLIADISLNAASIEQAVLLLQAYLEATFPIVTISTKKDGANYTLNLDCSVDNSELRKHLLDTTICFMYRELKLMLTDEFIPALRLPYNDREAYNTLLNASIETGPGHQIVLDISVLKTELNKKKVKEIEHLLPQFMLMLNTEDIGYSTFSLQVKNMILNMCSPEVPTFEQVSKQFPLSDRSIQRKLTGEGQSFRKIADDIKRELSGYLAKGKLIKTQDIAYILGYSDPSAYLHAVKRWEMNV